MIPKKANSLYTEVAEDLNIDKQLLENTIDFFYKEIRTLLSNLAHPRINVNGLGQFVVKSYSVKKGIEKYTRQLENHDTSTFSAYFNKKSIETKLDLLIKMEKVLVEQELKKETFKKKKDEEYPKTDLEQQETDN
jgi:nucleoid DNA-binding protein